MTTVDGQSNGIGIRTGITELVVPGRGGVPGTAGAVVHNVAVTGSTEAGFVTMYGCGAARPNAASVNYAAGQTTAKSLHYNLGEQI